MFKDLSFVLRTCVGLHKEEQKAQLLHTTFKTRSTAGSRVQGGGVSGPFCSMAKHRLPHPSLAVLLLLLLLTDTSTPQNPIYMVLVPSLLHTGTPEKGCLLLSYLNETVSVSAFMESVQGNQSLFTDLVIDRDLFQCVTFTIPQSLSNEVVFLTVQVKGPTQEFRKRNTVLTKNKESLIFVQTDKPVYKPEQTVKFRVVSLDNHFHPLNELIPLLYIQDPNGNRIEQWQSFKLERGLKQLSFPLSSEPPEGSYKVVVWTETGRTVEHSFSVEEFVLPRFEVKVTVPKTITIMEEEIHVLVCGTYTYGKPVPGHVTVNICRKYSHPSNCFGEESMAFCETFSHQLNDDGCFSQLVETKAFQLKRKEYEMQLEVNAKIQEHGTDVEGTGKGFTKITRILTNLSFVNVDPHFRPGIPFVGQVRLVDGEGIPVPHAMVFIEADEANHHSNATTGENGLMRFSIITDDIIGTSLTVRAKYKDNHVCYGFRWLTGENVEAQHIANAVFSPSKSFVHLESIAGKLPCDQTQQVQAHYILNGEAVLEMKELVFYYLIMAKGGIIRSGTHTLPVERGDTKGHFSIFIPVETDLAPVTRLLLFIILPDGEIVADTVKYEIGNCLDNKVNLIFSKSKGLPASRALLSVTAFPHSLCALRAVDQSVLLMKPEAELSASSVYDLLPVKDLTGFPEGADLEEEDSKDCIRQNNMYINGILYSPVQNTNEEDIYDFLKDMGLKVFTNSDIRKHKICEQPEEITKVPTAYQLLSHNPVEDILEAFEYPQETIRKYFPETWIWDLVVVDSTGMAEIEMTVPDTITTWKAGAFCLSSDAGLGLSPITQFQAFQPFFLELEMPYSVIRGESFKLKATVLNYLQMCIQVAVHLEASPDFLTAPLQKARESHCVCVNERHIVSWIVTPKSLGNVNFTVSAEALNSQERCGNVVPVVPQHGKKDTVIKSLLVEPEGLENEVTFNSVHCPEGTKLSEQISLKLPPDVVEDSAQASVTVLGDILGTAVQNTEDLLEMPYGCGEQNMALFAPNIYVLDYLNVTQQLTQEIKDKAVDYLKVGYQRQLNYKHQDGAYSTFGDKSGRNDASTWLTAFVLKSFAQAQNYIFIHEALITQAVLWLSHQQNDNGCFRSSGSLINNAIKGGVEDEVTLSAYVTIALLEMSLPITHIVVRNALFCLDTAWKSAKKGAHGSHAYTKALLAYAFALAGNQDMRKEILESLDEEAVKEDNSIHWTRPQKHMLPVGFWFQPQASSAEVEMTAYVLLAYLTIQPTPDEEDLTTAMLIIRWLTKQQNSNGGFSSTQDTVVALQALSKYGIATFTGAKKAAQVTIYSSDLFSTKFQVNNGNQLLLQRVSLPTVPGDYTTEVTGEGCVYLQTSLKYNVQPEEKGFPFALVVQTLPHICHDHKPHTSFQILLNISYIGSRFNSNMAIADVKMVSGFVPLKPTVKMLEISMDVSRTEVSNDHVLIYMEKVSSEMINLSFMVQQEILIRDLKPAIVKVYDYYEKGECEPPEQRYPTSDHRTQECVG
ncbi:alpha-2-macroglobulin-like isoform X1 [Peromyscus eremicus]|uniref:alpha-2-macroglobulin-like isoform X1 n=1 Tax=Peromyscus eremicus TaxID=42410 RepID=UPI0027DBB5FA|nr:alpha-2-macroglobulin-like isoform X1 [Peromyscus eremicus]XP_059114507.1 alpha-2-macroglobulin-like isoform X1 [Peromyscus eremicus]